MKECYFSKYCQKYDSTGKNRYRCSCDAEIDTVAAFICCHLDMGSIHMEYLKIKSLDATWIHDCFIFQADTVTYQVILGILKEMGSQSEFAQQRKSFVNDDETSTLYPLSSCPLQTFLWSNTRLSLGVGQHSEHLITLSRFEEKRGGMILVSFKIESPMVLSHKLIFLELWNSTASVKTASHYAVTSHKTMPEVLCPLICVFSCYFCHSLTQRKVCLHSLLVQMVMAIKGVGVFLTMDSFGHR